MEIKVIANGIASPIICSEGENLLSVLQQNGFPISAPCGGNGKCGKCKVTLVEDGNAREVLACKTSVTRPCCVLLSLQTGSGLVTDGEEIATSEEGYGLAVDIGTTTLALYFIDLKTGRTVKTASSLNPQQAFGADVISRIVSATQNGVQALSNAVRQAIIKETQAFLQEQNLSCLKKTVIAGNTVMLHLFAEKDISSFGYAPYTPLFLHTVTLTDDAICDLLGTITLLPSVSSFVGADVVCGALVTDLCEKTALFIDLGTNGEIMLSHGGKLYATSVAAGPAFEGADIECGKGGVSGAICRIDENGFSTVNGAPADGICGSGLIDAVAMLLRKEMIDETGAFTEGDRYVLTNGVYLSQKDVRKFQLAKSAVRSGMEILLARANLSAKEVDALYVAGGMGYYVDKENGTQVGLFPSALKNKIEAVGNTAGLGAKRCLLSPAALRRAEEIAAAATTIDLSQDPDFVDAFAENMFF
ncbi:MAG: DUF4445 domain-containing protein [Clostridia bacterium]|nr:DUF4445 domain-containing protein [Clostridia bacterium]